VNFPPRRPFLSLSLAEAGEAVESCGGSPAHAGRIRRRLLLGGMPGEEANGAFAIPRALLERMEERYAWLSLECLRAVPAPDGSEKHLLRLADGETVEAVRLPGSDAPSACLSIQVGCGVACRFCASGLEGVRRNLAGHEVLEQVALLRRFGPVKRLVFMGAGEPTHNLPALEESLAVLQAEGELGNRHVLVSTVGPAGAIDRLRQMGRRFTLAVSLHSLDREVRGGLIPTQPQVEPLELLAAADRFQAATGRFYQVEYVLLGGVNDSRADARELARALKGRRAHASLIGWNPVPGMAFEPPTPETVRAFLEVLREEGVSCTLRRTVGAEATAACGQLRAGIPAPSP